MSPGHSFFCLMTEQDKSVVFRWSSTELLSDLSTQHDFTELILNDRYYSNH